MTFSPRGCCISFRRLPCYLASQNSTLHFLSDNRGEVLNRGSGARYTASYGRAALPFLLSCHMIRCTEAMCQKCHHPTSCEGQICNGIMGNNIQSCAYLPPCHLMEGRAVGISEKMIAKKKLTEKLFQPAEHSLFSHLHKELQVTLLSTSGQLEGCPSREYLGCVFYLHHHMVELYQGHRLHEEAFNP